MSNYKSFDFREASVQFPKRERAYVFFSHEGKPFKSATLGFTEPSESYYMRRSKLFEVSVFEYVIDGEVEIYIDGEWQSAKAGDFYILSAGMDQFYRSSSNKPCKKIWINYVSDYMQHFLAAYGVSMGIYRSEKAKIYFDELFKLTELSDMSDDVPFKIADLIHKIVKVAATEKNLADAEEYEMMRGLSEYVYKKLNLDDFSEEIGMSKSNVIRKFKKKYGITPYEYLIGLKLEAAKILLRDTDMSIKEISEKVAINDEHYFSSLFLRRVGMRPLSYRKSSKNLNFD